jgi:hypothetical protein
MPRFQRVAGGFDPCGNPQPVGQLQQQMAQPVILSLQDVPLGDRGITFRDRRENQGTQCLSIVRQARRIILKGIGHTRILHRDGRPWNRLYRLNTRPIEAIKQRRELNR